MNRSTALALAVCAACTSGGNSDDFGDAGACTEIRRDLPVAISRDIDILFVVDGSVSMLDRIDTFETNALRFANVLENIEGGLPNLHIGAVSTDVEGHGGALVTPRSECGIDGAYLRDVAYANGERDADYSGDFAAALQCLLTSGPIGGTLEEPLEATRRALDGSNSTNAGFLRGEAFLFVVYVTDEDDCSGGAALGIDSDEARSAWQCFSDGATCAEDTATAGTKTACTARAAPQTLTPIAGYAEFLRGLKPDPTMVMVAALTASGDPVVADTAAGPVLEPACDGDSLEWPAVRMRDFVDRFPQRGSFADVCSDDWSDVMILVAEMLRTVLGVPCLEYAVDLEPDTPGIQAECVVTEIRGDDQRLLPACSSNDPPDAERPCWTLAEDVVCEDFGFRFDILRGRESVLPGTVVETRCFGGCY